jgi:uncharacterized protein YdcH (DUF465 family)
LTADFDARTACYVRFYHEHFQKDKPELLSHIKRATKSDMQSSKDDVDDLRSELNSLKDIMASMQADYDRRLTEMSYEYNRRISALSAEHDKLAILVQQWLATSASAAAAAGGGGEGFAGNAGGAPTNVPDMMRSLSAVAAMSLATQNSLLPTLPPTYGAPGATTNTNMATVAAAGQKRAPEGDGTTEDEPKATKGRR